MDIEPEFLTKRESEIFSSLKKKELNRLIRAGQLRAFRVSAKRILISRQSLLEYIERQEITPENRQVERNELQQLVESAIQQARARIRRQ